MNSHHTKPLSQQEENRKQWFSLADRTLDFGLASATHKLHNLDVVVLLYHRFGPVGALDDSAVEFNGQTLGWQIEKGNEILKGRVIRGLANLTVDLNTQMLWLTSLAGVNHTPDLRFLPVGVGPH